jgi:two-component system, chemotaxis family, sensor kinase CheA
MANSDLNLDHVLQTFIVEARELLEDMEGALLRVADEEDPKESIAAIFRAAHTIKGSAGLFGLDAVVTFTHVVESVLDDVRDGTIALDESLIELMLACGDYIGRMITTVDAREEIADPTAEPEGAALLARLHRHLSAPQAPAAAAPRESVPATTAASGSGADAPAGADHWHISLRFGPDVLRNGMDPLSFIRYLATLGTIEELVTLHDAVPGLETLDPEACCLGFEIAFRSDADKAAIENVFEFVIDDCALRIVPPHSRLAQYLELIEQLPEQAPRLGEILVRCGSITAHELERALQTQARAESGQKIGSILAEQAQVAPRVVEAALAKQKQVKESKSQESQSVRVDAGKLDRLINLVGELIIATAGANLIARRARNVELQECNSTLADLVEEVRDSALQLRMVKIGATFGRFKRVVHDVARELGKDVELKVSGEDTELDKTVVEKIGDPLMHLVRNAMDHGIDAPDVRAARGKPAQGTVALNAYHDSGSIVIQVSDDGGGLDRERILAKAVERGLVEAGRAMTDAEIYALIFEPGFSTAEQITNLSGRGVGMDVVKRNITALRGSVAIASEPGRGTTVTVRLPLTLAIINGFQVGVGTSVFVVPMDMVDECIEFSAEAGHDYTDLRGQVLPFIRLRDLFDISSAPAAASTARVAAQRQNIVVVKHAGQKFGLVVDALMGEAQTVIKPLSKVFAQVRGISGSSILGSGDVALILDVPVLMQEAQSQRVRAANPHGAAPRNAVNA